MRGETHLIAGVLIGAALWTQTPDLSIAGLMAAGALGALAPDLDHPNAKLSRRVGLLAAPIRWFVRHRGVLHSALAVVLMLLAVLPLPAALKPYWLCAALGYASHIGLDLLTVQGVLLLWPSQRRVRLMRLVTGGLVEIVLTGALYLGLLRIFVHWLQVHGVLV